MRPGEMRLRHGLRIQKIFPLSSNHGSPSSLYRRLRELEDEAHMLAMRVCNGDTSEAYIERVEASIKARLDELLHFKEAKIPIEINLDARGYALKIPADIAKDLGIERDWGGYGIVAPVFT